jgi:hypothetical protein
VDFPFFESRCRWEVIAMQRTVLAGLVAGLALGWDAPCLAQSKETRGGRALQIAPPSVQRLFGEANQSLQKGDLRRADEQLKAAAQEIEKTRPGDNLLPARELKADLLIRQGQLLLRETGKSDRLEESLQLFRQVATADDLGSPRQKAIAQVNAGAVLMRLNRPAEAADIMENCDWDQFDAHQWNVLYFNSARALDEAGRSEKALERYSKSLKYDPDFAPAAERLEALAMKMAGKDPAQIRQVGQQILDWGATRGAARFAVKMLPASADAQSAAAQNALGLLLLAWARAYSSPEQFERDQAPLLTSLSHPNWQPFLNEVRAAQRAELNLGQILAREPGTLEPLVPFTWSSRAESDLRNDFATYLAATARYFLQKTGGKDRAQAKIEPARLRQAFARIYGAWTLHPEDLERARQVAWLTHDFRQDVDPDQIARRRLIDGLFRQKGTLYFLEAKTDSDWENLLELHTFLGLIFESDKNWGSTSDPRSALGQWSLAIRAEEQIRQLRQDADYRAPGLHERLAACLAADRQPELALDSYVTAGEGYLKLNNAPLARNMLEAVRKLPVSPTTAAARRRLDNLAAQIAQAPAD